MVKRYPVKSLAQAISFISSPFFVGIAAVVIITLSQSGTTAQHSMWLATILVPTFFLPFIFICTGMAFHKIGDIHVTNKEERTGAYLALVLSGILAFFLMRYVQGPPALKLFCLQISASAFAFLIINLFWKISGHSGGIAASCTVFALTLSPLWWLGLLTIPFVAWSRVYRGRHTWMQGVVGTLVGMSAPALLFYIY